MTELYDGLFIPEKTNRSRLFLAFFAHWVLRNEKRHLSVFRIHRAAGLPTVLYLLKNSLNRFCAISMCSGACEERVSEAVIGEGKAL